MENSTKIEGVQEQPNEVKETIQQVQVDYDKINQHIKQNVENEVGKFIKNFMENNTTPSKMEVKDELSEQERELKEWRI